MFNWLLFLVLVLVCVPGILVTIPWGSFQQYISRGLGASSSVGFLNFRLFNTPEINLITLTAG